MIDRFTARLILRLIDWLIDQLILRLIDTIMIERLKY